MTDKDEQAARELKLDLDTGEVGRSAWADALKDLERSRPARPEAKGERDARASAETAPMIPLDPKEMSADELVAQAITQAREASQMLEEFIKAHPYLMAPNVHRMWSDHLQEMVFLLERQRTRGESNGGGTPG